jgi:2-succinyl-5-enolpyruvyl-6-hydroxy-3-cyclohexene-1-carboxylate synthase
MTPFAANDVQAAFARVLVDEWVRAGVTDAVACPGSRSTPLLVALAEAAEQGAIRLHVLLDERSAGFFGLGLALASPSGSPAVVVTTSGTAAAELHPAVLEAHHSGVPMLAVTADRPPELQDSGAHQTIHQVGLFGDAVRWEASPGVPELAAAKSWRGRAPR